jgi:hypothetical protein
VSLLLELLNSSFAFHFRIDEERNIDLNLLFRLGQQRTQRERDREREKFSSLFLFFLLIPNHGHFVIVQTYVFLFQIELQAKNNIMKTKLMIIFYLVLFNICSIIANHLFDFRFVSYNGMYIEELTPFLYHCFG